MAELIGIICGSYLVFYLVKLLFFKIGCPRSLTLIVAFVISLIVLTIAPREMQYWPIYVIALILWFVVDLIRLRSGKNISGMFNITQMKVWNISKIITFLKNSYPNLTTKWWHRLILIVISISSIALLGFILFALINAKAWDYGYEYKFSFEQGFDSTSGNEYPCQKVQTPLKPSGLASLLKQSTLEKLVWIVECEGLGNRTEEFANGVNNESSRSPLLSNRPPLLFPSSGLDCPNPIAFTKCLNDTDDVRKLMASNEPLSIKEFRAYDKVKLLEELMLVLLGPVLLFLFLRDGVYRGILWIVFYIVYGSRNIKE